MDSPWDTQVTVLGIVLRRMGCQEVSGHLSCCVQGYEQHATSMFQQKRRAQKATKPKKECILPQYTPSFVCQVYKRHGYGTKYVYTTVTLGKWQERPTEIRITVDSETWFLCHGSVYVYTICTHIVYTFSSIQPKVPELCWKACLKNKVKKHYRRKIVSLQELEKGN